MNNVSGKPPVEAFPHQGLDLETRPYDTWHRLEMKYLGQRTPLGTRVSVLVRMDRIGILASKCGYCNEYVSGGACRCQRSGPVANVDDFTKPFKYDVDVEHNAGNR